MDSMAGRLSKAALPQTLRVPLAKKCEEVVKESHEDRNSEVHHRLADHEKVFLTRSRVVKVRVTEAEYSDWTEMALRGSVSLSETIRRAMQGNTPPEYPKPLESLPVAYYDGSANTANATITYTTFNTQATPPRRDDKHPIRRTVNCSHGYPPHAFCPKCDQ